MAALVFGPLLCGAYVGPLDARKAWPQHRLRSGPQHRLRSAPPLASDGAAPGFVAHLLDQRPRWLKKTYRKLATPEDTFYGFPAHKTLGIFCVCHAAFRLSHTGPTDMGFGPTLSTLVCILAHATLSLSSFLFRIPKQRRGGDLSYGMWSEYRLQSIIFTMRSLGMMALIWTERVLGLPPNQALNAALLFASMAASDISSRSVGPKGRSRTVRDLNAPHATRLLFSIMQIQTTSALLLGQRRFSMHFIFVLVMQFNAFLMTLRRKALVPYWGAVTTYGAMTIIGSTIVLYETSISQPGLFLVGNALGNFAATMRIGFNAPKYPLWLGMAAAIHFARKTLPPPLGIGVPFPYWPALAVASNLAILAAGWRTRPAAKARATPAAASEAPAEEAQVETELIDTPAPPKV